MKKLSWEISSLHHKLFKATKISVSYISDLVSIATKHSWKEWKSNFNLFHVIMYRVSSDFMLVLPDLKSWGHSQSEMSYEHGSILNSYGAMGIWNVNFTWTSCLWKRRYHCTVQYRAPKYTEKTLHYTVYIVIVQNGCHHLGCTSWLIWLADM
jgi:hypothetical protein